MRPKRNKITPISSLPEYVSWKGMIARCTNPQDKYYPNYGGRGINVFEEWIGNTYAFIRFVAYMGPKPSLDHSIDRIDNNKGYFPGNVRWATYEEQTRNRRNSIYLEINGECKTAAEWAQLSGISLDTLRARLRKGWTAHRAVFEPLGTSAESKIKWPPIEILLKDVQMSSCAEQAKVYNCTPHTVRKHLKSNGILPRTWQYPPQD